MCFPLRKEREEGEGESRSLLEVKQKAFEGLIRIEVGQETAPSIGGGTYCIRSTCIWILLSSLFASLEGREEAEGKSRSPLGAEQGTLREYFGLRWAKKIAASAGGGGGVSQYASCVPGS